MAIALALALVPGTARAITGCSFVSVVGVSFGAYDVFSGAALDSTGSITLNCTGVQPTDQIVVDLSKGGASSYSPRQMSNGGYTLSYNLYLDASRTSIWGDATGGTSHHGPSTPPDGSDTTITVYGRIPALQNAGAGAYSDSITVTVLY